MDPSHLWGLRFVQGGVHPISSQVCGPASSCSSVCRDSACTSCSKTPRSIKHDVVRDRNQMLRFGWLPWIMSGLTLWPPVVAKLRLYASGALPTRHTKQVSSLAAIITATGLDLASPLCESWQAENPLACPGTPEFALQRVNTEDAGHAQSAKPPPSL